MVDRVVSSLVYANSPESETQRTGLIENIRSMERQLIAGRKSWRQTASIWPRNTWMTCNCEMPVQLGYYIR